MKWRTSCFCLLSFVPEFEIHFAIRLMAEIDKNIAARGGWPAAFAANRRRPPVAARPKVV